jgi:hypothetical protein
MTEQLIQLTDVEIAEVAGGAVSQTISITASQSNSSTVTQTAIATNSGAVTATAGAGGTAAAAGAEATNTAIVSQSNAIVAANIFSVRRGRSG